MGNYADYMFEKIKKQGFQWEPEALSKERRNIYLMNVIFFKSSYLLFPLFMVMR